MWVLAMFALPTDTKQARRHYTQFRKSLLRNGFTQMQYSVYIRHCASRENTAVHAQRVEATLPPHGEVRLICITDKQFEQMQVFWGQKRKPTPRAPVQLELF